jgi:hypothetical protein
MTPIGVFVRVPGTLRITEINSDIRGHCEGLALGHLQSAIPDPRAAQRRREFTNMPSQCSDLHRGVFAGHLDERRKTRMTFH